MMWGDGATYAVQQQNEGNYRNVHSPFFPLSIYRYERTSFSFLFILLVFFHPEKSDGEAPTTAAVGKNVPGVCVSLENGENTTFFLS